MNNKILTVLIIVLFILIILIGIVVGQLINDFGLENLGKSISGLYKVKTDKDINYIEISDNIYLVKNENSIEDIGYDKNNNIPELSTVFRLNKNRLLYTVAIFDIEESVEETFDEE